LVRSFHKYLSLAISIQLLLWTISGIYFAFNKIELIRGEQYLLEQEISEVSLDEIRKTFNAQNLGILKRLDQWIIRVEDGSGAYYTDLNGNKLTSLTKEQVKLAVKRQTSLTPVNVTRITSSSDGSEYRGRELPLFKVTTSSEDEVNVYVDAVSGEVKAIRSDSWRWWDLLWSLHIMDYTERENIDNFLLKIFSILALISSLSGITLFFLGLKKRDPS
tara:strand:- start:271 stop:924 length:654 start_codon:yes stop_codon:yes gene_type:complete